MKTKFALNAAVKNAVNCGTIKEIYEFADHIEYLVEWPDKTGAWIHEDQLEPSDSKPTTTPA